MRTVAGFLFAACVVVSGCFGGRDGSRTTRADRPPPSTYVHGCDPRIVAPSPVDFDYRKGSLQVGPVTFVHLNENNADAPRSEFAPQPTNRLTPRQRKLTRHLPGRRYLPQKSPLVIEGQREVTVVIAKSLRRYAALLYGPGYPGGSAPPRIEDGVPAVRFKTCGGRFTQYAGGFVVAGARCVPLYVWTEGRDQPARGIASFGVGRCD